MVNRELLNPSSIVVVGASNDVSKPGGKILKNILDGYFKGDIYTVNPKESSVQGVPSFILSELPPVELAILALPAAYCLETVDFLTSQNQTKAFIIVSAGFSETDENGREIERKIVEKINEVDGCLIGPNCIGVLNSNYHGVFTAPIPLPHKDGCDLISSSGATAVFIMEAGLLNGLKFSNVYSIGNAAQTSAEDILEYMDEHYDPETDAPVKLLYLESIKNPQKLLKHSASLIKKGVRIAAIKSGATEAGGRAAMSHTGAIVTSDMTVRALFQKAGIVYCSSREELINVAAIFNYKELKGQNIAVITHAGGSAVMLTDTLTTYGLSVPPIEGPDAEKLMTFLHPGSSVHNPIDFLATGTAEQLSIIIDYCEHKFDHIDGMVVVFGSPGLMNVKSVYNVLSVKLDICKKPIYPVLPSVINAEREIKDFLAKGNVNFPDEVMLGRSLAEVYKTPQPQIDEFDLPPVDTDAIRAVINNSPDGFLSPESSMALLDAAGIPRAAQFSASNKDDFIAGIHSLNFPVVMKVIGPIHKSELGGVVLNVNSLEEASFHFDQIMKIEGAEGVLFQSMLQGTELYMGVNYEALFGRTILCGLGGIFVEVMKDVSAGLSPISKIEAEKMIKHLKAYEIIKGTRGKPGVNEVLFAEIIQRLSALTIAAPEIVEMDINPLLGNETEIIAVDTRISIQKDLGNLNS